MEHPLSNELARLAGIGEEVRNAWADAKVHWKDANSERFETEHVLPLLMELSNTLKATEHLAKVMSQARRECESEAPF